MAFKRNLRRCPAVLLATVMMMAAVVIVSAGPASACSCAGAPFEVNAEFGMEGINAYEAVFIGTLSAQSEFGEETQWTFDIDSVAKGDLATPIEVITPSDGGACGFENLGVGDQRAVGLFQNGGYWHSGLCSIDSVQSLDGIGDRRDPEIAIVDSSDDGISSDGGLGLGLIGLGFAGVLGTVALVVVLSRRPPADAG